MLMCISINFHDPFVRHFYKCLQCQGVRLIAMLCGHVAPIVDLAIGVFASFPGDENIRDLSNVAQNSISVNYDTLFNACSHGALCV